MRLSLRLPGFFLFCCLILCSGGASSYQLGDYVSHPEKAFHVRLPIGWELQTFTEGYMASQGKAEVTLFYWGREGNTKEQCLLEMEQSVEPGTRIIREELADIKVDGKLSMVAVYDVTFPDGREAKMLSCLYPSGSGWYVLGGTTPVAEWDQGKPMIDQILFSFTTNPDFRPVSAGSIAGTGLRKGRSQLRLPEKVDSGMKFEEYNFRCSPPQGEWDYNHDTQDQLVQWMLKDQSGLIQIFHYSLDKVLPVADLVQAWEQDVLNDGEDPHTKVVSQKANIDEFDAFVGAYEGDVLNVKSVFLVRGNHFYILMAMFTEAGLEQHVESYDALVNSFRPLE